LNLLFYFFTATIVVTDDYGQTATDSIEIEVKPKYTFVKIGLLKVMETDSLPMVECGVLLTGIATQSISQITIFREAIYH